MTVLQNIKRAGRNPFKTFKIYQSLIAIVCISIPALLRLFDKDTYYPTVVESTYVEEIKNNITTGTSLIKIPKDILGFRNSISDYVYSSNSFLFGMLLCMGAMLFVFNGAVYYRNQHTLTLNSKGKWYNVVLGIALLGVICTPHRNAELLHYFFAIIFFFGNALVIGFFYNSSDKKKSITMSLMTIIFLSFSVFIEGITLLWSEWLSLSVIGVHLILETRNKPGANYR